MADIFDYLKWRGDLSFDTVAPNPVDMLIFSTLSYIRFEGIVSETLLGTSTLKAVAKRFLEQPDIDQKVRVEEDILLLAAMADTNRFGKVRLSFYRSVFETEKETQFAAMTFFLEDGTAVLTFRGTDQTLTGWKEDFNMTFTESIPAQKEAVKYVSEFAKTCYRPFYLVGHSKGGNLAVYAAAKSEKAVRERIIGVYNQDGPGFTEYMMNDPEYEAMVPKIHTYIPQSSIVGMMLEHEEPYKVIKSRLIGPMQHNPYLWEVIGPDFVYMDEVTPDSKLLDRALKNWLAGMSMEERSKFVDSVYEILTAGGASQTEDLITPKNIRSIVKALNEDEKKRQLIAGEFSDLVQILKSVPKALIEERKKS